MTDSVKDDTPTLEEVRSTYDSIGSKLTVELRKKAAESCNTILYNYGNPQDYRALREMAQILCESTALWLVARGYATLTEKGAATDADREARLVDVPKAVDPSRGVYNDGGYA